MDSNFPGNKIELHSHPGENAAFPDGTRCRELPWKAKRNSSRIQVNIYKVYLLNRLSPIEYFHCGPGGGSRSALIT